MPSGFVLLTLPAAVRVFSCGSIAQLAYFREKRTWNLKKQKQGYADHHGYVPVLILFILLRRFPLPSSAPSRTDMAFRASVYMPS